MSNRSNKAPGTGLQQAPQIPGVVIGQQTQIITGPIPNASEFQGYETAVPGSGNRILSMAELEAKERHTNTRRAVWGFIFQAFAIPTFGFLLAGGAIYAGFSLSMAGHDGLALAAIITGAGSLVGAFVAILRRPSNQ